MALTPEQEYVVRHISGHLIVIAGPGSGKTHTMIEKIRYLFEQGTIPEPYGLLAITFTNTAVTELQRRLRGMGFRAWDRITVMNFHGFAGYLLRCYGSEVGIAENYDILDPEEQNSILQEILDAQSDSIRARIKANDLKKEIELYKRNDLYPGINDNRIDPEILPLYASYQQELHKRNAADFGDIIVYGVRLLRNSVLVRRLFTTFYRYVIVDEFQDTDPLQLELVRIIASSAIGSTVVADDDQSIYRFRGANRQNINILEKELGAERKLLGINFRSDQVIVEAAQALIHQEASRRPKDIAAASGRRGHIHKAICNDEQEEANQITQWLQTVRANVEDLGRIAIIVRSRWRANSVLAVLEQHKVPFFDRSQLGFQETWATNLSLAILELACDPRSSQALYGLLEAVENAGLHIALDNVDALDTACMIRDIFYTNPISDSPDKAVSILKTVQIRRLVEALSRDKREVKRLIAGIHGLIRRIKHESDTRGLTLADVIPILRGIGAVQINTAHSVKGAEFDYVFLAGLEDDIIPSQYAQTIEDVDEERRILYVGITRARKGVYLTCARHRKYYSRIQACKPSRFFEALPIELFTQLE